MIELLNTRQDRGQKWNYFENGQSVESVTNEILADYLLANGVIHIPCKVGDMVYQTDGVRIYELTILDISLHKNMPYYETDAIDFDDTVIGKTVFLTKEEAERELERRMK